MGIVKEKNKKKNDNEIREETINSFILNNRNKKEKKKIKKEKKGIKKERNIDLIKK